MKQISGGGISAKAWTPARKTLTRFSTSPQGGGDSESDSPQRGGEFIRRRFDVFPGNGGESGFTLIEVLVALTILSISLATLLAIFMQGLDRARESKNEAAARTLAQSLLIQAKTAQSLAFGTSTGTINGLQWRTQVAPYGSDADRNSWQTIPAQIVATVSWRGGSGGLRSVSLSTLKLYPKPGVGNNDDND